MFQARHVADDRLFDCYVAARAGEVGDLPSAEHLAECSACATRYNELAAFMDGLASGAAAESDAVFTAERLRAQEQQILRRIEHAGRSARVISFPHHPSTGRQQDSHAHGPARWVAAAAAAGLFIGVGLGVSLEWQRHGRLVGQTVAAVRTTAPASERTAISSAIAVGTEGADPSPGAAADDAFLLDLDVALERTHARELVPFDTLTPHVRDIRDIR